MPEKDISDTTPVKVKKVRKPGLKFTGIDLIIFFVVSGVILFVSAFFWLDLLASVRWLIGSTFVSYINLAGFVIAGVLLLFCLILFIVSRFSWRGIWIVWGVMILFMTIGIALAVGFRFAIKDRMAAFNEVKVETATEHYMAGEQLLQMGNLQLARDQFYYVLQLDPSFPGAMDKIIQIEEQLAVLLTPTVTPTLTPVPTLDTRNEDEIYNQAKQHQQNQEWGEMLEDLETLRNIKPDYKVIEMDGLYYLALRMRGIELIFGNTQRQLAGGNLEEGIYMLNLAAKFAPLDSYAVQVKDWARVYINAAAYWGVNWQEVVDRFAQIAAAFPNMVDVNHITAARRYVEGMVNFADYYAARNDFCNAGTWYQNAKTANFQYNVLTQTVIAEIDQKIENATLQCWGPTSEPVVETSTPTPTETLIVVPSETPTETLTP